MIYPKFFNNYKSSKQILSFIILCLLWLIFPENACSQEYQLENFKYLESKGKIPEDFTKLSLEKYKIDIDKDHISEQDNYKLRKTKKQFLLESNYIIDEILLSGKILFNDPLSVYINNIADELLKDFHELRSSLRFYVTKSPSVNAFATDQGIIFVNLGLIAQVEDEAQLAFVLAHEIIHYVKKHGMEYYIEKEDIIRGKGNYKRLSMDEQLFAMHHRSKEMENEADKAGFLDFYLKSNYSLESILGIFDVLQYAYLPFDDIVFTRNFFESSYLKFPDSYYLEEIQPISGDDDYDDSKSTHPNIIKRRTSLIELMYKHSNEDRKDFIQSREDFFKIRDLARFEAIRQYIINTDYGNAIYNSYLLLAEHPDNKFLEKSIATSLYSIAIYKNDGLLYDVLTKYQKVEGESQQLYYFLHQLSKDEISVLALQYCWNMKKKYPNERYFQLICDDLIRIMVNDQKISLSRFSDNINDTVSNNYTPIPDSLLTSKYERIRKKRIEQEEANDDFLKYAFVEAFKDPTFKEKFEYYDLQKKGKEYNNIEGYTYDNTIDDYNEWSGLDSDEEDKVKQRTLGLDNIIILDPIFIKLDERKRKSYKFIDSELSLKKFYDKIINNANIAQLDVILIDSKSFHSGDIIKYNEFSLLHDWFAEKYNHEEISILQSEYDISKPIFEKYKTPHIALTGIISSREWKPNKFGVLFWTLMIPYALPWSLHYAITPDYSTSYFFILINSETGENELTVFRSYNNNDRIDILNSILYDTFLQIKKEPKK
ncbi:M48 family metallopeptidase [Bacteroidota bacterium]